jgi:hypothetical protein
MAERREDPLASGADLTAWSIEKLWENLRQRGRDTVMNQLRFTCYAPNRTAAESLAAELRTTHRCEVDLEPSVVQGSQTWSIQGRSPWALMSVAWLRAFVGGVEQACVSRGATFGGFSM